MGSKKLIKALCVLFSCFMIFSTSFAAEAQSVSSLKSEKEKIQSKLEQQQKKLDALEDNISNNQTYVNELVKKVDLLQDKLDNLEDSKAAIQSEINSVQSDIDNTQAQIDAAQKEIEAKEKEFESIYQQYCQRLRAMYISGNVSTLEVLLESGDISSVLTRSEMVKCVAKQDNATLDTLMKKMQEIQNEKQEMEKDKLKLEEDKKTLTQRKADLQSSIDDYNASKKELDAEVSKANTAIKSLKSDKAVVEGMILGVISGVISLGLVWAFYEFAITQFGDLISSLGLEALKFSNYALPMLGIFIAIGIVTGVGGALLSMGKYLNKEGSERNGL